jgi:hypothetical protein
MKQCKRCSEPKLESEFNKGSGVDGLQNLCREHSRAANRAWVKANPDKNRAKGKRFREANPIDYRHAQTKSRLKRVYGLSPEQYLALVEKQHGKCAICPKPLISLLSNDRDFTGQPDDNVARVDHCHETGRVRGLLCFGCNVGLGKFKDDIQLLLKAVRYLDANRTAQAQSNAERKSASEIEPGNRDLESSIRRGSRREDLSPFLN